MYIALGVKDIEQILPVPKPPEEPQPTDPAMENSLVLMGKPPMAFPQQSHEQHIKAHRLFMSSAMIKTNPMVVVTLISHINQHVSMLAATVVNKALQEEVQKLQQEFGEQIPPEMIQELEMKKESAINEEIIKMTEAMVTEEAEAMQNQSMDPLVLLKQQELALRKEELELRAQKDGENQALKEGQFDYKQQFDAQKLKKDYDLANLRADVTLQKTNTPQGGGNV
tara:strand:+ start:33 stop:707 length:675 start_codon:yes stop_codon:yes gene_type:complete